MCIGCVYIENECIDNVHIISNTHRAMCMGVCVSV